MFEWMFNRPILVIAALEMGIMLGLCPVSRRKRGLKALTHAAPAFLLLCVISTIDAIIVYDGVGWRTSVEPVFGFLLAYLIGTLILKIRPKNVVFVAVWTHILAEVGSQILLPTAFAFPSTETVPGRFLWFFLLFYVGIMSFLLARYIIAPQLLYNGEYQTTQAITALSVGVLIVYLIVTNYQFIFLLAGDVRDEETNLITAYRIAVNVCALTALYLQNAFEKRLAIQQEYDISRQLWLKHEEQYRTSQENIDLINRKCHDIKHQIAALRSMRDDKEIDRQIRDMESAVMIYDSAIKTGSQALDIVLTEKNLVCEVNNINLTCMIDGSCLGFINKVDLFTMFANALDNAIECVSSIPDPEKRVIQIGGGQRNNFMLIRVRNYCETPPVLEDGLPKTTKSDKDMHGFGVKSIRSIAEKYGGSLTVETEEHMYSLQLLFPLPQ